MYAPSADALDTVAHFAGLAVRDRLANALLLTRHTGTTPGVHTGRAQALQRIHPQCRRDNDLSQGEERRA